MDVIEGASGVVIGAVGVVIAVLGFVHSIRSSRGQRFADRVENLTKHRQLVTDTKAYGGDSAEADAQERHDVSMRRYELEIRANAALYLRTVSRLRSGGSFLAVLFWSLYSVFMIGAGYVGVTMSKTREVVIDGAVFMGIGLMLAILAARSLSVRIDSMKLRAEIGVQDPASLKSWKRILTGLKARWRDQRSLKLRGPRAYAARTARVVDSSSKRSSVRR